MYIAIDFDGTCVSHEYPNIGRDIGAVPVLKQIVKNGHKLILLTMRSHTKKGQSDRNLLKQNLVPTDEERDTLKEAVEWFEYNDIPLYAINENPTQKSWTLSPKVYAHLYIDDASLGIPLKDNGFERPFVDWFRVEQILKQKKIIS